MSEHITKQQKSDLRPEMRILIPATLVIVAVAIPSILWPESSQKILKTINSAFTANFGSLYLWVSFAMVCLSIYFVFSRFGDIKFGEPDEKPEFGNFGWIAMMFCTGVAGAVMFWSVVEPLWDLLYPPQHTAAMSTGAYDWSLAYVFFHWGPLCWPWYVITALPICYMFYKLKRPVLRMSAAAEPLLGEKRANGTLGQCIDVFFVVGLVFTNAVIMAISIPIVNHAVSTIMGIAPSKGMEFTVIVVSSVIFCGSLWLGLKRGIQRLSNLNVTIALAMIAFAFLFGPTQFIIDTSTNAFGVMMNNYFKMQFWTDPFTPGTFPQDWTIFYALWMASYGPVMGLFIARISRGRTVRQIITMGVLGGTAGSYLIHGVFGSYTLYTQLNGIVDAVGILEKSGGPAAMVAVLHSLPMGTLILIGYCIFSTIFLATSVDSCSLVLSTAVTRKLQPSEDPSRAHRLYWALLQAGLAIALLMLGGLGSAKIFGGFAGALMVFPIVLAIISWFIMLRNETAPSFGSVKRSLLAEEKATGNIIAENDNNPQPVEVVA